MNKLLVAGLVASVAMTTAKAETCGNGGFYVGANFGLSLTRTKVDTDTHDWQKDDKYTHDGKFAVSDSTGDKKIKVETAKALSESIANTHDVSKKKAGCVAELVIGYDFRLNDVMMGADLTFGTTFGKQGLKSKNPTSDDDNRSWNPSREFGKLKRQWHIGLMPRVGYLFMPQLEGYVTFGMKIQKLKYETYKHGAGFLDGKAHNGTDGDKFDSSGENSDKLNEYNEKTKKSSTRVVPVIGAGIRYEITPELFTKLEYNFELKSKAKMPSDGIVEVSKVKTSAHVIKLGLGYRF